MGTRSTQRPQSTASPPSSTVSLSTWGRPSTARQSTFTMADNDSPVTLRTQFGGGKTSGFALVYDSPEAMKKFEPKYRLIRVGLATKTERPSRQQRKQKKNRQKTLRGTAKVKGAKAKKDK